MLKFVPQDTFKSIDVSTGHSEKKMFLQADKKSKPEEPNKESYLKTFFCWECLCTIRKMQNYAQTLTAVKFVHMKAKSLISVKKSKRAQMQKDFLAVTITIIIAKLDTLLWTPPQEIFTGGSRLIRTNNTKKNPWIRQVLN